LRAAENVESEYVITAVDRAPLIDRLVHVADFHTPRACVMSFEAEANEDTILIKTTALPPVCIIESDEQLIPNHERAP